MLAALYGPEAPRHVYLLVDGTLRAEVAGLFDLDVIEAPARSLFQGEAEETMGEAGPWLVDMSISDPREPGDVSILQDLLARHWPAGYSILVSTDAPFEAIRRHLRRFIQLPILEDGRSLTFRFWDPRVLGPFLATITQDRSRARRMTMTDEGTSIVYMLPVSADATGGTSAVAVRIVPDKTLEAEPLRPMRLRYADFDTLARSRESARRDRMTDRLRADFAPELADRPATDVRATVDAALDRFGAFGFQDHAHLHFFAAWSLFYGPDFEQDDPMGELEEILRSDAPETERFRAFRRRFETFTKQRVT
ncbi:DUF4123 domain-containing protein [Rhodovulum sulfidophilum]|uniref:DUF4123 domain-containing protein n=1 Tax=Rhodovulum sulfidophilum TaxID=35806 RepID=A0ABS1RY92_RHOSU|nr:DUF4123 domain-containing protein [Rhodovulum sulfidophilum]MBL3611021.1 DUF4123 domain-containing protein [Rhodovulum sulfidophilum]MCE8455325.1 DUF4123 domain-containing protein [Rhodovulum sulfidophilum]